MVLSFSLRLHDNGSNQTLKKDKAVKKKGKKELNTKRS